MWSSFNQIEMYVCMTCTTLYMDIAGVGLQEHLLTIFYMDMVGHQLTRFEICQNVSRLNG